MQIQHTPAPWKIQGMEEAPKDRISIVIANESEPIAFVLQLDREDPIQGEQEQKNNAQLIAKASELLEACEMMELAFKDAPESWLMTSEVQNAAIFMREVVCLAKGYELINPKFH